MPLLSSLLIDLVTILQSASGANAVRDPKHTARVIITDICDIDRASQLAHPNQNIDDDAATRARNAATRHANGEPLSRIRGVATFYDLDFKLSPNTLDPRQDTEILVRTAVDIIHGRQPNKTISLLDLGTGTGCIPIAILKHAPNVLATAVDISDGALQTAQKNATSHGVDNRLTLIRSNWYESVEKKQFDIITSNPPYIPTGDISGLDANVRLHDPIRALDGGVTGLDPYEILFAGLDTHLTRNGIALFEIGIGQGPDMVRLGDKYRLDVHPPIVDDAGIPRVICITRPLEK